MPQGFDATVPQLTSNLLSPEVRGNLLALVSCHSGPAEPSGATEGWLWLDTAIPSNIKLKQHNGTAFVTLFQFINSSPLAAGAVTKFTHTQVSITSPWSVNHNLGTEDVIVMIWDASNEAIIPNTIEIVDVNNITITFSPAQSGRAVIIG